jgi:hypothetical protein
LRQTIAVQSGHIYGRVFCLLVFWLAIVYAGAPARADDNANSTRETIQQLIRANDLLIAGKVAESRALVQEMGNSIRKLKGLAYEYREIANREHTRCTDRIADLDVRTNQLYVEQTQLSKQIQDLSASLVGAAEKLNLATAEVNRLNAVLTETIRTLREREAKLQELKKWWWVPGYGQYLQIRTLVDNDIGQYSRTLGALNDQKQRLKANSNTLAESQALIATLRSRKQQALQLNGQLTEMRASAQSNLERLNGTSIFLTDAEMFWGTAQNLLEVDADSYVQKMNIILSVLAREDNYASFSQPSVTMAQKFQQKIVEFADSLDKQSNFLLKDTNGFCGGPPLAPRANAPISRHCSFDEITSYYEIVDPKTCSFRYINPPGCPPAAKSVSTDANALSRGRSRGAWTRVDDQNWIGRASTSPCTTAGTIYYGKPPGPEQCEAMCMGDADCTIWTFNKSNGFMPNSRNQCWGGPASLEANKSSWGGFTSGGIR